MTLSGPRLLDELPHTAKVLKSVVAPACHGHGTTLYFICQTDEVHHCAIYEQLPDGSCLSWSEPPCQCIRQAEGLIFLRAQQAG